MKGRILLNLPSNLRYSAEDKVYTSSTRSRMIQRWVVSFPTFIVTQYLPNIITLEISVMISLRVFCWPLMNAFLPTVDRFFSGCSSILSTSALFDACRAVVYSTENGRFDKKITMVDFKRGKQSTKEKLLLSFEGTRRTRIDKDYFKIFVTIHRPTVVVVTLYHVSCRGLEELRKSSWFAEVILIYGNVLH